MGWLTMPGLLSSRSEGVDCLVRGEGEGEEVRVCSISLQEFFSFLLPLLRGSVQLLELYCDVSEVIRVILELFTLMAENYIVFLSEARSGRGL